MALSHRYQLLSVCLPLSVVLSACGPRNTDEGADLGRTFDPPSPVDANGSGAGDGGVGDAGDDFDAPQFKIEFVDALLMPDAEPMDARTDALELCGLRKFTVARVPPDMLMVLDRSGSMMENLNGDDPNDPMTLPKGTRPRWIYTAAAIKSVLAETEANIAWGMKMYPTCKVPQMSMSAYECVPNSCAVDGLELAPDIDRADAISQMMSRNGPVLHRGATPTAPAIDLAVATLTKLKDNGRPKYLLLATDGIPNCGIDPMTMQRSDNVQDVTGAVEAVKRAAAAGIPVYVLGLATPDPSGIMDANKRMELEAQNTTLNMMAEAGGRAREGAVKYYPANDEAQLKAALAEIAAASVSCTFPLGELPENAAQVAVDVDGERLKQNDPNGWALNAQTMMLELKGTWCDKLKRGQVKDTKVTFGCPGKELPPPEPAL